jgi:hypothetical protein
MRAPDGVRDRVQNARECVGGQRKASHVAANYSNGFVDVSETERLRRHRIRVLDGRLGIYGQSLTEQMLQNAIDGSNAIHMVPGHFVALRNTS